MSNPIDPVMVFVQTLASKGIAPDAALRMFKDMQFEALGNLLLKKGLITQAEWDGEHARMAHNMQEKIIKMPHVSEGLKKADAAAAKKDEGAK